MNINSTVPGPLRWLIRGLGFSLALVFLILPMYRAGSAFEAAGNIEECDDQARFRGVEQSNLFYVQRFSLCMFLKSGFLSAMSSEQTLLDVMALPSAPCSRVGVWKSARNRSVYEVTLRDDGRFSADPVVDSGGRGESSSGYWGEHGGKMVWIYDEGVIWPPDVNPIEKDGSDRFTLLERNGERTEFTRESSLKSVRCMQL